jgi:hypothetical protein
LPQGQDPEPVDRSDANGQPAPQQEPIQEPLPPQSMPPQNMPPQNMPPQGMPPRTMPPANSSRPAYGLPAEVTLKPGTFVTVRIAQSLSSDRNQPGDTFIAHLAQPVVVDGVVVAQRGQTVYGRVAEAVKAHAGNTSRLGLELTSLTLADGAQAPIKSQLVARSGSTTPAGVQAGTVAGTTAVGAAVGAAADWGTGAAVGAGVGAMVGMAGVLLTRNHPTVLYPETALTFRVDSPVTVSTLRAPQAFRFVGPEDYQQNAELRPRPPVRYGPAPGPYFAPYPYPYYYGPYAYGYPYPYWGPGFGIGIGVYGGGWRRWR